MSEEKKKPRNCLEEIKENQDIINALMFLQQRDFEHYGFIKDDKIIKTKEGDHGSVRIEITPSGEQQCEYHTHPDLPQRPIDLNEFDLTEIEQQECGAEGNRIRRSIISDADAYIQAELRPPIDLTSLLISNDLITQYILADQKKYAKFVENIIEKYGNEEEINIRKEFHTILTKFYNESKTEIYDKQQNFSFCGQKEIWVKTKQKWHNYLTTIGMEVTKEEVEFKGDPKELEQLIELKELQEHLEKGTLVEYLREKLEETQQKEEEKK